MTVPDPLNPHPMPGFPRVGLLKPLVGDGAIVAARSVVSRDVPPYAIAAGNPAKVVKARFDAATVARLLARAWRDWPVDKITRKLDAIRGADIARLEAAA